ncbi:MAG TPA: pyridoxal-dependent decarboxylase, partial [Polyangiaceae bacterium]|nr:pyridoxal-dependent decarboxylase [Polyangiaceae bacterium]
MNPLDVSADEYRKVLARVAELCADYAAAIVDLPSFPNSTAGATTLELFGGPAPKQGAGPAAIEALRDVLEHSRPPSPRFFGSVLGSGEPVAAAADLVASLANQNVTAWRSAPAAVTIERTVVRWLAEAIGCAGFSGSLTGGGSSANLMALAIAREAKLPANEDGVRPGVFYASEEIHMSIPKAIALLGFGHKALRLVPVDERFRIRVADLERAMDEDARAGRRPVAVIASAGTVNTGAIDPLAEVASIARGHGAWFHVDGAYGALAALGAPEKFRGIELADSLSLDAHKW